MSEIRSDQHVFIAGMTGSGKTFLAKTYLAGNEKPVYVLDTKSTFTWEQLPKKYQTTITTIDDLHKVEGKYKGIIYRPRLEELELEFYDEFFKYCYFLRDCTVDIDEVMEVSPTPTKIPKYYKGILTKGRELNVNVWSCTQRPSGIALLIYDQSTHWFVFKLQTPEDREKICRYTGYQEFMTLLPKFDFLYYCSETSDPPIQGILKNRSVKNV